MLNLFRSGQNGGPITNFFYYNSIQQGSKIGLNLIISCQYFKPAICFGITGTKSRVDAGSFENSLILLQRIKHEDPCKKQYIFATCKPQYENTMK